MAFTVAIIGRPNVGKSTLFNRLSNTRHKALVDPRPGATRDRRVATAKIDDQTFNIIDTAGLEQASPNTMTAHMMVQTDKAIQEADLLLMVVDVRAGLTGEDSIFAKKIRKSGKPVILVLNKSESSNAQTALVEFSRLGFKDAVATSAEHAIGLPDLWESIMSYMPEEEQEKPAEDGKIKIAIIGRPNAGKSTLMNQILGEDRVITSPVAGTTRDAIAIPFAWKGTPIEIIDTAGMRRKSRIEDDLEKRSVSDALEMLNFCHIVILVVDAGSPLDKQDLTLGDRALSEGRVLVIAINKWDTVTAPQKLLGDIYNKLEHGLGQVKGILAVPISARTGYHVPELLDTALEAYGRWNMQIPTSRLNDWLIDATEDHSPPMYNGKQVHLRYATQSNTRPPTFLLFSSTQGDIPEHYRRYLAHHLSEAFNLNGLPVRVFIRKKKNPYANDENSV
jgi:GTP-binding protein